MKKQSGFTLNELVFLIFFLCLFAGWCVNLYILCTTTYPSWNAFEPWVRTFVAALPLIIWMRR